MPSSRRPNVAILGLLVPLCLLSALGFGIAEQIVDTDPHVVLEVGTRGILPCHIQRRGYSVEWKRQLSSGSELLVSLDPFFDVGEREGPGYEAGLFNITDDYSLVIKDVKVQDEGIYICSFSDYQTGMTFRNSTRVSVQAFPDEPFPTIQECIGNFVKPGVCTLTIHSTSNLTCLVRGYYPDIDLFFLRGIEKVTPSAYEEWNNRDGTKNKNITIQISVSDEPYQCVASKLPGTAGNRSVSVIVQAPSGGPNAAAIVAPVLIAVVVICLLVLKRYLGNGRGRCRRHSYLSLPVAEGMPLKVPKGPISKLELWELITKAKDNDAFEKLKEVLQRLGNSDGLTSLKDLDFHDSLCKWKSKTPKSNQRMVLYSVCCEVGMTDIIKEMIAFVMDAYHDVSSANIEHVLWDIGGTKAMIGLLKSLKLDHKSVSEAIINERNEPEVTNMTRTELHKWRNRKFDKNPLVILSLKLDHFQCKTNFFGTPKGPVSKLEIRKLMTAATENDAIKYLKEALRRLSNTNRDTLPGDFDFYESLCKWKSETSSINNQRDTLYSVCCDVGMADIIRKLIVPTSMKKEMDEKEMRDICCQISKQHFMYLVKAAPDILGEELSYDIEKDIGKFVEENNQSLFHTLQMLYDWEQNEECSNYEKRNKVQEAVKAALQSNHTDASWPPDEELRVIASFLSSTSMEKLCSKLEIECPPKEGSEEERFQSLIEWRDNHASSKDLNEKHIELFNAFKEINQEGKCNKGIIPLSFIHKILEGTDPEQRLILGNLIRVAPFTPVAGRLSYFPFQVAEWSRLEAACKHIHAWTEEWIMQIIHTKMKTGDDGFLTTTEIAREHRDFNDKLVDNGFIALAREIMISEQQLIDV